MSEDTNGAERDDERDETERDETARAEHELRDMLEQLLSGNGAIDPAKLAGAAGMPADPAQLAALMQQLQSALSRTGDGVDWNAARQQALAVVQREPGSVTSEERHALDEAARLAAIWLDEVTAIAAVSQIQHLSRQQWVEATLPVWQEMSEPVASSIADALMRAMHEHAPDEAQSIVQGAERILRNVGGTMFAMQLGHVVGELSREVVAGGDFGFPLLDAEAAMLPNNLRNAAAGLEIPDDQVRIWMATRELAHARLFHHAKWLRLHVLTSVREYAEGISIDVDRLEDLAASFDPTNPEELREAMRSGSLIPPKSEEQLEALGRLETMIALIDGWVDAVTEQATARLPKRDAIAETVRRRRATGGPAEKAFGTLVGLEIRPRRLREAAAFWRAVGDAVGADRRDSLWDQPDLVPDSADIDDPSRVIARLNGTSTPDELDLALRELLDDAAASEQEASEAPHDQARDDAGDHGGGVGGEDARSSEPHADGEAEDDGETPSGDGRPVES